MQEFYRPFDRKQWDRAERMCHRAYEVITRNHSGCHASIQKGVSDLRSRGALDDCLAEQEAWRRAIQALMCMVSLFGMVEAEGRPTKGLQGWRTDATRSLAVALQASRTAFPEEDLRILAEDALEHALCSTERVLAEDLQESGVSCELEPTLLARTARDSCEVALRRFVEEQLRPPNEGE